jgi:hypothetical protein
MVGSDGPMQSAPACAQASHLFAIDCRPPKPIDAAMVRLRRLDNQAARAWLRDVINRVASGLRAG